MLPHVKSMRNWRSSLNGEPRFLQEVLNSLHLLDTNGRHCILAFDVMSIRKQIIWNDKNNKFLGHCDFRNNLDIVGNETATEVLVFMAVRIYGKWKLPIGYFYQNKIPAVSQAELVKTTLTLTQNAGLKVSDVQVPIYYKPFYKV